MTNWPPTPPNLSPLPPRRALHLDDEGDQERVPWVVPYAIVISAVVAIGVLLMNTVG